MSRRGGTLEGGEKEEGCAAVDLVKWPLCRDANGRERIPFSPRAPPLSRSNRRRERRPKFLPETIVRTSSIRLLEFPSRALETVIEIA